MMKQNQQTALLAILIGMIMSLSLVQTLSYKAGITGWLFKEWDVKTCTPADYTVWLKITDAMYANYLKGGHNGSIEDVISDEIEKKVNSLKIAIDGYNEGYIKVATCFFGFKNGDLIRKLEKRGKIIGLGKFNKVEEQDRELNQMI